ncbi:MAG TPA: hypothetical protein DEA97_07130 [Bacteroidales bacterium]|nr:hypothetical protein [Bacteroidales bacterium]
MIAFEETRPESYLVKYEAGDGMTPGNRIIKRYADGKGVSVYTVRYTFSYKQKLQIVTKPGKVEFLATLEDVNYSGDIVYKGFQISGYLLPRTVSYKMNWMTTSLIPIKSFDFNNVEIAGTPITFLNYIENDTTGATNYKMEIVNKVFKYSDADAKAFEDYLQMIDEYQASDVKMQKAFLDIEKINPNDLDRIHEYKSVIDNIEIMINDLNAWNFPAGLNLTAGDPINFMNKFSDLKQIHNQAKTDVYYTLNNLHQIYYNRGLEMLVNGKTGEAEALFNKSINANMIFAPAHYQLAKIYYNQGKFADATDRVRDILNKLSPDPSTRQLAVELAYTIYDDMIKYALELSNGKKYNEAVDVLNKAKNVCESTTGLVCNEKLKNGYSTVLNAQYDDYLKTATDFISAGNFEKAKETIKNTKFFVKSNSAYITQIEPLNQVETNLYNMLIYYGNNSSKAKKYTEALGYYDQAGEICSSNPAIPCTEELNQNIFSTKTNIYLDMLKEARAKMADPVQAEYLFFQAKNYQEMNKLAVSDQAAKLILDIKQKQYDDFFKAGFNLLEQKNYDEALKNFEKASVIELSYEIKTNSKLKPNLTKAAKNICIKNIESGTAKVQVNDLKAAREYYTLVKNMITQYEMQADLELEKMATDLKNKIFSQECRNKQAEYDKKVADAIAQIKESSYIIAENYLNEALDFAAKNSECEISTKDAENKRSEILPGSVYQKLGQKVDKHLEYDQFKEAIEAYQEFERHYYTNNVAVLGIKHMGFHEFFKQTSAPMINYAANYYLDKNDYKNSLDYMKELERKTYNKKNTKNSQTTLGTRLAIEDFKKNAGANPKQLVVNYTNGSKYFSYLSKAYLKQWKKLQ